MRPPQFGEAAPLVVIEPHPPALEPRLQQAIELDLLFKINPAKILGIAPPAGTT